MYPEDEHVAHPRLYGAPAYARPPLPVTLTELPPDPDDLPIAAYQTPEEQEIAERLLSTPFGSAERMATTEPGPQPRPRSFLLGSLAGKILRRAS
jgi:hypothetical protein